LIEAIINQHCNRGVARSPAEIRLDAQEITVGKNAGARPGVPSPTAT
jgi:hypothetical protein